MQTDTRTPHIDIDAARAVAETILQQLGGRRFLAMTGARNLVTLSGGGLQFDLPRTAHFGRNGINRVRIELTPADLYDVTFQRWSGRQLVAREIASHRGAYCDDLARLFTKETGLDTRL